MIKKAVTVPELFKGIALFTPGGDLVYCIDPSKQGRWHLNLSVTLQDLLSLPEPPHFLVPGYTATLDRWRDPYTHQIQTSAEAYPAVQRYQALLNAIFETHDLIWQTAPWLEEACNPILLETYHPLFPQLWESHDLVVRVSSNDRLWTHLDRPSRDVDELLSVAEPPQGYVLRLFVSGNSATTKQILETLHQLLEQGLRHPYTLKVVDISKHPEEAETNQVSAIPTLLRVWPQPVKRIVGELDDWSRVLQIIATN